MELIPQQRLSIWPKEPTFCILSFNCNTHCMW